MNEPATPPVAICPPHQPLALTKPRREVTDECVQPPAVPPARKHPQALHEVEDRVGVPYWAEQHTLRGPGVGGDHWLREHEDCPIPGLLLSTKVQDVHNGSWPCVID